MKKKLPTGWQGRVLSALNVLDKNAKRAKIDRTHTADGKKLKVGLKVYLLDDPIKPWKISDLIADQPSVKKGMVELKRESEETVRRQSVKLFFHQGKAVSASIRDVHDQVKIIHRDFKERMDRLDPANKLDALKKLQMQLVRKNK